MSETRFRFLPERCVGCGACVSACLDEHAFDLNDQRPWRCISQTEQPPYQDQKAHITWYSHGCLHCAAPACLDACPMGCFFPDPRTGTVQLTTDACIGCGLCLNACPHGAIQLTQSGHATKCNGCRQRLEQGLPPRCAAACPCKAILYTPSGDTHTHIY